MAVVLPPDRRRTRNPGILAPSSALPAGEALARFLRSPEAVRRLLHEARDLDLSVRFANPSVPGLRFRLQAGFLIVGAHDRRHLWPARQVRADALFPLR